MKVSATSMQNFMSCKRKYFYYKTHTFKDSLAFELGKAFEDGFEQWTLGKSIEESVKYSERKFNHEGLNDIGYKELERKFKMKGMDTRDDFIKEDIREQSSKLIEENNIILKDMLPRLIKFIKQEGVEILQMQLTTIMTMENGNKNEVRIDGLCMKDDKKYIFELKSYKIFKKLEELKHNIQLLNYVNVLKRKGEDIEGVLFCQVKKTIPQEPKVLKGNKLSTDKRQKCNAEDYYNKAVEIYGDNIPDKVMDTYIELYNKTDFIEMIEVVFTDEELDAFWEQVQFISEDMDELTTLIRENQPLAFKKCYPNHSQACNMCNYKLDCYKNSL